MPVYTPQEYADQVYYGKVSCRTVHNWIKNGKMPQGTVVEYTPTGRVIIKVLETKCARVTSLVKMMEAKYNGS